MTDVRTTEPVTPMRTTDETLTWHSPFDIPDADETVLIFVPTADEPIDFGHWDGESWCCASIEPGAEGEIQAWAHMPEGRIP